MGFRSKFPAQRSVLRLICRIPRRIRCRARSNARPQRTVASSTADGSIEQPHEYLRNFTRLEFRGRAQHLLDTKHKRVLLKQAVKAVASQPWPEANYGPDNQPPQILIGVLASDVRLAVRSLRDYVSALGLPYVLPTSKVAGVASLAAISGPVYIKYSAAASSAYATSYKGRDRGVLLTFGQEQVGHLPLGLFDEDKQTAAPSMS